MKISTEIQDIDEVAGGRSTLEFSQIYRFARNFFIKYENQK